MRTGEERQDVDRNLKSASAGSERSNSRDKIREKGGKIYRKGGRKAKQQEHCLRRGIRMSSVRKGKLEASSEQRDS